MDALSNIAHYFPLVTQRLISQRERDLIDPRMSDSNCHAPPKLARFSLSLNDRAAAVS